jgi:hypothetical protein
VIAAALALGRGQRKLLARLEDLERRLDGGEDVWAAYSDALRALVAITGQLAPEHGGPLLSTAELAQRLNVSPKTILRRKARGELRPAVVMGKRGRSALRWRGDEGRSA